MKQYEQILSKITPTFYKLLKYENYFDYGPNLRLILSYLNNAKLPIISDVELPVNYKYFSKKNFFSKQAVSSTHYYYSNSGGSLIIEGKKVYVDFIELLEKKKFNMLNYERFIATFPVFVVNMVINNFSFENEPIVPVGGSPKFDNLKSLFMVLVGKDTYETIRANIK